MSALQMVGHPYLILTLNRVRQEALTDASWIFLGFEVHTDKVMYQLHQLQFVD